MEMIYPEVYFGHIRCAYSMHKDCAILLANCGGLENNIQSFLKTVANDESLAYNGKYQAIDIALCAITK